MNRLNSNIFITICFWCCSLLPSASANPIKTTLQSSSRDKIEITYTISEHDGDVTIDFYKPFKGLSSETREKYEVDDVKILFFEQNGNYSRASFKFDAGMRTEVLNINSDELDYKRSDEGYVFIKEGESLSVKLVGETATLKLPIYLVHYDKPEKYTVFAKCNDLTIELQKGKKPSPTKGKLITTPTTRTVTDTITEVVDDSGDVVITPEDDARLYIKDLENGLLNCYTEEDLQKLDYYRNRLDGLKNNIKDKELYENISTVLKKYDDKAEEFKKRKKTNIEILAKEDQARADLEYLKERMEKIDSLSEKDLAELGSVATQLQKDAHSIQDESLKQEIKEVAGKCESKINKKNEAKERRNIFMIIGGILLAILLFVGNQVFQHFRNLRNIKSMEDAQNQIARRAQDEARRRTQNAVRSRMNNVQGQVRQKTRSTIQSGVKAGTNKIGKGIGLNKKNLSI